MIDMAKVRDGLAGLGEINAKLVGRDLRDEPSKRLTAAADEISKGLQVKRNYEKAQKHDLDAQGNAVGFDLSLVGTIEEVRGTGDRLGCSVRVVFPDSSHLWFDPNDLDSAP